MKTIYKYPITANDIQTIRMPEGARILCVQSQHDQPCVWAMVDTEHGEEHRRFGLVGTGHPCDSVAGGDYVGTFQLHGGSLVFHLFDMGAEES